MTTLTSSPTALQFEELDPLEAPSWETFYQGLLAGITVVGIGVAIAT